MSTELEGSLARLSDRQRKKIEALEAAVERQTYALKLAQAFVSDEEILETIRTAIVAARKG